MSLWSGSSSTISLPSSTPRLPVPSSSFTPGPSVIFPCFGDNMKLPNLHLKSGRTSYLIECGVDLLNGDVPNRGPVYVNNFRQCLKACDAHAGCSHVAFSKTPSATGEYPCYLKHSKSTRKADGDIISGAIPTINATNKTVTIEYVSPFKEMDVGTGESSSSVVAVSSSSASAISSSTNSSSHQVPLPWSSSKSSTRSTSETETETKPSSISQFVSTVAMPDEVSSKTSASPSAYSSTAVPSATSTPSGYVPARSSESSTSAQPSTVAPHTTVVSFSSESLPSTAFNGNSTVQPIGSVNATYSAKAISQLTTTFYPVTTTNPRIYATSSEVPWTENVSLSPSPTKDEVEPVKSLEVVAWNSTGPITADPTHIVHPTSSPVENSTLVKHVGGHDVFRPILLTYKFPASVSGNSGTVSSTRTPIYSWVKSRSSVIKPTATHGMNSTTNGHTIVHGNTFIDTLPSVSLHVPWNASATVTPPTPIIVNATTAFLASTSTSNVGSLEHGQAAETTSTAPDGWSRLVTKTLMSTLTLPLPLKHAYSPWKYYNTTTFANATTSSLPSTSTPVVTSSTYGQAAVTTFTPWTFRNRATSSFSSVPVSTTLVGGNSTRSSLVSTSAPVVSSSTNGSSIFVPTLTHYNPTKSVVSCSTNGSWIFVATHTCYDPTNSVVPHGWSKSNTGTLTTTLPTSSIWSDSSSGISTSASRNGTGSVHFASTVIGNLSILYPHTITAPASSTATGAHLPETTFTWYDSAASVAPTSTKNGTSSVLSSTWALQVPTPSRQYVAETTFTRYDPAASIAPAWNLL
ncbi:hypothetical protein K504DRAFT_175443 [Pleomassaria siparia CBS 279.74]|uniref:Apple domain-containing protein n=1 Tax=Pleomassaria siparia CBS 279.74 TaxID=1314801 RepID=A0A6G1JST7_9PLEO|nr:hypothetical protein K504DRAFT_175443 [Pleomassaria siparia CBS 279.74]